MKLIEVFEKIGRIFARGPHIGGLEISHDALKYLLVKGGRSVMQASVPLPPNVIKEGKIQDESQFLKAAQELRNQVGAKTQTINVNVVVPSALVFAQSFSVPLLEGDQLNEAIELNLQMLSPEKIEESYYDWQEIQENKTKGHLDLLGAFTSSAVINTYTKLLTQANFHIVSIEFPGLALARLIGERWAKLEKENRYLVLYVNGEGILMLILKNGSLYFNHFNSWQEIMQTAGKTEIAFESFKEFLSQEIQRVLNFYLNRAGAALEQAILIAPSFNYEIVKLAEEYFKLKVINLALPELGNLSPAWFPVLGAALRGLISRSRDTFISLTEATAKTEYYQERTLRFIHIWRNITIASLIFVLLSYVLVDTMFAHSEKTFANQHLDRPSAVEVEKVEKLKNEATHFNQLLELVQNAKNRENEWSPFLITMELLAEDDITLERVFVDQSNRDVLVVGSAKNEQAPIDFKNRLARQQFISNVELPLSQIQTAPDNATNFSLSFHLESLAFENVR